MTELIPSGLKHLQMYSLSNSTNGFSRYGEKPGCGLDDRGSVSGRCYVGSFSLDLRVQTGSGAHPASCPVGTRGSYPGGKAAGSWTDHSPLSSAEVKNVWSYISIPPLCLHGMAWCLVKHRDFALTSTLRTYCEGNAWSLCMWTHTYKYMYIDLHVCVLARA
jgi:hypothetical protein